MNIYVGQYKDIVKNYYKKQREFNRLIAENNKRFSAEYASKENKKIEEQQWKTYGETKASIEDVFRNVRELLASANFVNVESLTADRLLFDNNSSFDLSAEEVQSFVERYEGNYTMLRLIKDWVTKNSTPTKEYPVGKYAGIRIVLPADMVQVYKTFADSALSLVDKIYKNGIIMQENVYNGIVYEANVDRQGKDGKSEYPYEIDNFGDENFATDLFAVIGNGMKLSDYKTNRIPESAMHVFDSVKTTDTEGTVVTAQ